MKRIFVRGIGLVVLAAVAMVLLVPPIQAKRETRRVKSVLLTLQAALQNYHVAEEMYPRKKMSGGELIQLLGQKGHLKTSLENPWDGDGPYAEGEDWLRYRTDSLAETYELVVYYPETEEIQFRLDSTENQSLE